MCTKQQLKVILDTIYMQACNEFADKLDAVLLYGSYARGDYDSQSDVDIMVRVHMDKATLKKHKKTFVSLAGDLDLKYGVFVSVHLQDYETFEKYKDALPFYRNVDNEGVQIGA